MHTQIDSLESIRASLSTAGISFAQNVQTPALSSYSPVPSLQDLATQHSNAIGGSSGCAVSVSNAIIRELEWSSTHLNSLKQSIKHLENDLERRFKSERISLNADVAAQLSHNFSARPEFQAGKLSFHPAALNTELSLHPQDLLVLFEATRDEQIVEAIEFWKNTAATMESISDSVLLAADRLATEHEGDVFTAASNQLKGLSERIILVSESSDIMADSLTPLPHVRQDAVSNLRRIIDESREYKDITARELFTQSETGYYLNSRYLTQLQDVVPTISSLTTPHHAGNLGSVDSAANSSVGRFEGQVHQTERLTELNSQSATSAMTVNALPPSNFPIAAPPPSPQGTTTPNGLGSIGHNTYSPPPSLTSPLPNTSRQQPPGPGRTFPNSLMFGSSPQTVRSVPPRGNSESAGFHSDRQKATALHRNLDRSSSNVPSPPRHIENSNSGARTLSSPHSSGGSGGQSIHGNTASGKSRAHTGAAPRAGTPVAPINSMSRAAKGNSSPIDKVYKSRRTESPNANQKRLFGLTEPTVPGILGADLRE